MASTVTLLRKTATIRMSDVAAVASPAATTMKSLLLEGSKGGGGGDVAKRCCGRRCELVGYDALPAFLQHNEFILHYYRSKWPLKEALLSAFALHNETINVWT